MDGNDMDARDSAVFDESALIAQSVQISAILNVVHGAGSFRISHQMAVVILCLLDLAFTDPLQLAYFACQLRLENKAEFCANPFASDVPSSANGHFQSMILKTIRECRRKDSEVRSHNGGHGMRKCWERA
jgi:hypothetical protein